MPMADLRVVFETSTFDLRILGLGQILFFAHSVLFPSILKQKPRSQCRGSYRYSGRACHTI